MQFSVKTVESISDYSWRVISLVLYVGIFILTFDVVARYFFNSPTLWSHGCTQHLFGSYFILIGAYPFVHDENVRIGLVSQKCSQKVQTILNIVNRVFLVVWAVIFLSGPHESFDVSADLDREPTLGDGAVAERRDFKAKLKKGFGELNVWNLFGAINAS